MNRPGIVVKIAVVTLISTARGTVLAHHNRALRTKKARGLRDPLSLLEPFVAHVLIVFPSTELRAH